VSKTEFARTRPRCSQCGAWHDGPCRELERRARLRESRWPARFWALVGRRQPNECWEWQGCWASDGYGKVQLDGRGVGAHRVAWELTNGPIPAGLTIDHLCRNRRCVNPAHLEAVTQQVNVLRGTSSAAVNARRTHCVNGHEFTPENTYLYNDGRRRVCRTCIFDRTRRYRRRD
jgi:HNH endonuclease